MEDKEIEYIHRDGLVLGLAKPTGVTAKVDYVLEEGGIKPSQGHDLDVGMDMYTNKGALIMPDMLGSTMVGLGVRTQFNPVWSGMLLSPRSMMAKLPLMMGNTIGVIEGTYTGEIMVPLRNTLNTTTADLASIAFTYDEDTKKVARIFVDDIPEEVREEAFKKYIEEKELQGFAMNKEEAESIRFSDRVPFGSVYIPKGTRLVQAYLIPRTTIELNEVDELKETVRGDNGFGSTGSTSKNA